jgi:hypothetical protein
MCLSNPYWLTSFDDNEDFRGARESCCNLARLTKLLLTVLDNDHRILRLAHARPTPQSEHGEMSNPKFQIKDNWMAEGPEALPALV